MEGAPFGKYRLVALLGRGGMGEVWRAFDTATDRIVALKVLPAHLADDETFQKRFRREARAAAGLSEPHVVPIHGYGEIDGRLYVDMRLIVGRDLEGVLREGPLDPARVVMIVEQVASALHAAHQVGLLHRDVKPSNILLTDADFAYLIDFGIARVAGETGLTSTGSTLGTWAYMAPERFGVGEADHRSDVYSLACVLHECLTGQLPFPGKNVEQQVAGHLTTPPPQPSAITVGVPQAFDIDDVIAAGMAKNPDERYATTRELAQSVQAALIGIREPTPHPTVTAAARETQSARPQPQGAITGGGSSATSGTGSGTSSVDAVSEDADAEVLPSHHAPEVANDPADTRTQAGPTLSASDAPTQQAPVSAEKARVAETGEIAPPPRQTTIPPTAARVTQAVHRWESTLVSGVLTVILGAVLLFWSPLTIVVVLVFFGAYLLVSGVAQVVFAFSLHASGDGRTVLFVSGAVSLVLAVLAFSLLSFRVVELLMPTILIAVGFILRGGATTVLAIRDPKLPARGPIITFGVIGVVAGILVLAIPFDSLGLMTAVVCLCLMSTGVMEIVVSFFGIRKSAKTVKA